MPFCARNHLPLIVTVGVVLAAVAVYAFVPPARHFADETWRVLVHGEEAEIRNHVRRFGIWGPVLVVFLMTAQMFLVVVPSWALMLVAVRAYGPVGGAALAVGATTVASTVGYATARLFGEVLVARFVGEKTRRRLDEAVAAHGVVAVFLIRLAPFLSNDAVSFVAGLVRMRFVPFLLATLAGITPLAVLIAWLGDDWQRAQVGLVVATGVALLAYGVRAWRRQRHRRHGVDEAGGR